ncbi:hypothetical protein Ae706Ps2_6706 [Pseudonocardia sp. Ae706_Ps2]|nr:hypothetical protein Ae706Ps2_6706 [Pseudonocardia sp. Ae706_Ps2]
MYWAPLSLWKINWPGRRSRERRAWLSAVSTSAVVARESVAQPTTRLENASRTEAIHNTPSPVTIRVRSATHTRFGAAAVKSRSSRSGAGRWAGFCRVEPPFQPRRRWAPCRPCSRMIRSTRLRPTCTPWRRSSSQTRGDP